MSFAEAILKSVDVVENIKSDEFLDDKVCGGFNVTMSPLQIKVHGRAEMLYYTVSDSIVLNAVREWGDNIREIRERFSEDNLIRDILEMKTVYTYYDFLSLQPVLV